MLFLCQLIQKQIIMKKIYLSILAATLMFAACNNAPEGEAAAVSAADDTTTETMETPAGEAYSVSETSYVEFYGASPTHGQNGKFPISEGAIYVNEGAISGGNVTVNLEDMEVTTDGLEDEKKEELKGHLMSEDFFNAAANPTVMFEITEVAPLEGNEKATHTISGNLTMNGQKNAISFPAKIGMGESTVDAGAEFVINRKDWGMMYKNDESLGDKWIYDEVKMTLNLQAQK